MPSTVTRARSTLSVPDIARIFESTLSGRKVEFAALGDGANPFARFEAQPQFSVVASHDKNVGGWAVQLYVFDEGGHRITELHAVYHSMLERAVSGTKNTYSKSAGQKNSQQVLAALRRADPGLTVV